MTTEMDDFWQKLAASRRQRQAAAQAQSETTRTAAEAQTNVQRDRERVQRIGGRIVAALVDRSSAEDIIFGRIKTDKNILGKHFFRQNNKRQQAGWIMDGAAASGKPFNGTLITATNNLYVFNRLRAEPDPDSHNYYYFASSWKSDDLAGSLTRTDYQTHPEAGRLEAMLIGLALRHGLDSNPNITA